MGEVAAFDALRKVPAPSTPLADGPEVDGTTVDGAQLLARIEAFVRRFVVVTRHQSVLISVWILHTFGVAAFLVTPYLAVLSAEKRSGKSRLLEVLGLLVKNPWHAIQPSEAVLFRYIEAQSPTLLLDETDALFSSKSDPRQEAIRALLNSGNRRGVTVPRCANHGKELVHFNTYCAKAIAGIGKLPETVADRSVEIRMRRKKPSEAAERFRPRELQDEAKLLKAEAEAWASARLEVLEKARPVLPEQLGDRAQDSAEPLLAVADAAGGEWPELTRKAVVRLAGERDPDEQGPGVELLSDCRAILEVLGRRDGHIRTAVLLRELIARESGRWKYLLHGGREPLNAVTLAQMLRAYDLRPRDFKEAGGTVKGYPVAAFLDAFDRYLKALDDEESGGSEDEDQSVDPLPPATSQQAASGEGPRVADIPQPDSQLILPVLAIEADSRRPVAAGVAAKAQPQNLHSAQSVAGLPVRSKEISS